MKNFNYIEQKLHKFIKKYYTNEIIKGGILFLSFGLLYFMLILFIEYFLWLEPFARTILFWLFVLVELGLLSKFILIPIFKLIGLQNGISHRKASIIIGDHFKEIDDKLLNILQLNEIDQSSELVLASIEQKAKNLRPIPFAKAINFKYNIKYIKYLGIPIAIWLFTFLTGYNTVFTQSLQRVIHHKVAYNAPAPFYFKILNKELKTIEGKAYLLQVITEGEVIPEYITVSFNGENYYLNKQNSDVFSYEFEMPREQIDFYLKANEVVSNMYRIEVVAAPKIIDFQMLLNYPKYIVKTEEMIKNTGNATIPEGTIITWKIASENTEWMHYVDKTNKLNPFGDSLEKDKTGLFKISKKIIRNTNYQINTSNQDLKKFEKLNYQLKIIKDQYPDIIIKSNIDSISRGPVQFLGQLSDDYGLNRLQVIAKNIKNEKLHIANIPITKADFFEFFYLFPDGLIFDEGNAYEIYFEVFDNDGINGSKKTKSQVFYYNNKTQQEIEDEILLEQKQNIETIENFNNKSEKLNKDLEKFSKELKSKNISDWNDKKQLDQFLKRQKQYQEMLKNNSEKLLQNLEELNEDENSDIKDKKENLKRRIEEAQELQKKQNLLKELQELAEKLKKEDLLNKIDKLTEQTKQETRSLERILELTKRFYVEKKSAQIVKKLNNLVKEQNDLSNKKNNSSEEQEKLNQKFDSIQKDFKDLNEQNKKLKDPMDIQDTKADQKLIEMQMEKAKKELQKNESGLNDSKENAKKKQKAAAKRMEELSKRLKQDFMQMEMDSNEENIKDLQQILENLLNFSFEQEALMLSFDGINDKNPEYPKKLKSQIKLKEHFDHIDDSLYTLSLRLVRLTSRIQNDLTEAHYNLDKSLENITENRISKGVTNQQYTMTAANNLAYLLSDLLQNLQNKKPGSGKGKGKKGEELSLPDVIKKQGELIKKLKQGNATGNKKGGEQKEQMTGEQFEIYKAQNRLKEELKDLINKNVAKGNSSSNALIKKMDDLEKILLEKGITKESLETMQKIEHELLKLEKATFEKNKDKKRKSKTNINPGKQHRVKPIDTKKFYFDEDEILIRQNLQLKPLYQEKIKLYFKKQS
ncbi:MAG: hypothetical protein L3J34_07250 [Flavobacteriaceae bacterium]|nr:hypothetical protein [Flavobacteriaceae bacterium]